MTKVIVNGVFDCVHTGHIMLLNFAKQCGHHLLVVIDSDARVKESKGQQRPIYDQTQRKFILENLRPVDQVEIFDSDQELLDLIMTRDIMVKGSDYINQPIIGRNHIACVFFPRIHEYSTTKIITSIVNR